MRAILAFKSTHRLGYLNGLEMARLIEVAAERGFTAVVDALSDFVGHLEVPDVEMILDKTKRQRLLAAHDIIDDIDRNILDY